MISVQEAEKIILEQSISLDTESVSLKNSLGRILAELVSADRDFPPFDRVAMDGICIQFVDYENGQRAFDIQGVQAAGSPAMTLEHQKALEIMTGATLANNADTVIRYEDLVNEDGIAHIQVETVSQGQNVHQKGSDLKEGGGILKPNQAIGATEIGVLATVGKATVEVLKQPKIAIISTGDELVDVGSTPLPHQIRKSNIHSLAAMLSKHGITPTLVHLKDNKSDIKERLDGLLSEMDVVLLSGAVSKGKFDFLPEMLDTLGVKKHFHRVAQRPGKPFWFGTTERCTVFAFPGNPVSTFACATRFFEPWLKKSLNQVLPVQTAVLSEDVTFKPPLTYFLQVRTEIINGRVVAHPQPGNGSGDLANLARVNGFLELDNAKTSFEKGMIFPLWTF